MKTFVVWFVIFLITYGGLGLVSHVYMDANPQKIAIALDTSAYMKDRQQQVDRVLDKVATGRYRLFSLIVDKGRKIHGWQSRAEFRTKITYYGERQLDTFVDTARFSEIAQADKIILLSNAADVSALRNALGNRLTVISP